MGPEGIPETGSPIGHFGRVVSMPQCISPDCKICASCRTGKDHRIERSGKATRAKGMEPAPDFSLDLAVGAGLNNVWFKGQ
jgi:hypothetical protein